MKTLAVACTLLAFAHVAEAKVRTVAQRGWTKPVCTSIDGPPGLRFVAEPGLVRGSEGDPGIFGLQAIAAGRASNVLYAYFDNGIYESRDAGCSWMLRAQAPPSPDRWDDMTWAILPAGDRVYVHTDLRLLRLTGDVLEIFPMLGMHERIMDMAVDPADSLHLRGMSGSGRVFDSFNGGASWQEIGQAPVFHFTTVEVSPKNLDRLYGAGDDRTGRDVNLRSDDGGRTWTKLGLDYRTTDLESSPLDENVVWIYSTDPRSQITRLYGSIDGGRTFVFSIDETPELRFSRPMVAHAREPRVLAAGPAIVTMDGVITTMRVSGIQTVSWSPAGTLYYGVRNYQRTE